MKIVVIEPKFENGDVIERIRQKYDQKMGRIVPEHITLVYPFEDDSISFDELKEHVQSSVQGVSPFDIRLHGISAVDNYLFLNIVRGKPTLKRLQERLYTGILHPYLDNPDLKYPPHITLGRFESKEALEGALEELGDLRDTFSATVRNISLVNAGKNHQKLEIEKVRLV